MKKYMLDLKVTENRTLHKNYCLLKLTSNDTLPEMRPGQFVEVFINNAPSTFLRRPISIHYVDKANNALWLLIQLVGEGTKAMAKLQVDDLVNVILPLGNSFTISEDKSRTTNVLLIGGGVGIAPLLFLGSCLKEAGITPLFLLGARTKEDLLQLDAFNKLGTVYTTTEDGSFGEKGYVTDHSLLNEIHLDKIYTCGPKPMMVAVANYASRNSVSCEASLENTMACGIGACLCCVEKTKEGHVCVCTQGPVFNIDRLTWLI